MSSATTPRGKRAKDDLRQRQRELEALNRQLLALQAASANVSATLSLDELLHRVTDSVVQELGYKYAALMLVEEDPGRSVLGAISGIPLSLLEQLEAIAGFDVAQLSLTLDDVEEQTLQDLRAGEVCVTQDIVRMLGPTLPEPVWARLQERADMTAMALLPLLARGRFVGSLWVASARPTLSSADIDMLQVFADQAAAAIDNARIHASAVAAEEQANLLLDIQSAIAARLELRPLLTLVVGGAVRAVNASSGLLASLDFDTQEIVGQASYGLPVDADPSRIRQGPSTGVLGQVVATGRSARVNDVHARASPDQWALQFGLCSMVVVPIRRGNRVVGILSVHDRRDGRSFTTNDENMLAAIADQAAVAIEQARLYEEVRRRAQEQAALNLIAETAGRSLELQEVLENSLERVLDVADLPGGVIYLPDETGKRLILAAHRNMAQGLLHKVAVAQREEDLAGEVFRTGQATLVNLAGAKSRASLSTTHADHSVSLAIVPLRAKGKVLGVMEVGGFAPCLLTERDLDLLTAIGNQIGLAVENAHLYAEAQQRVRELALLNEVATAVSESLDLDAVLEQTLSHMQALTRADRLAVYLRTDDVSAFHLQAVLGFPQDVVAAGQCMPATDPFCGQAAACEVTVLNVQAGLDLPGKTYLHDPGLQSLILVPLRSRGISIGSVHLLFTTLRVLSATERQLLDTISRQVGVAVENAQLYQKSHRLAITDGLTGLYNYRYFYEVLGQEIEQSRHCDSQLALVMLDLDDFKEYNDIHGHLAGDDLLVDLARLLGGQIRTVDTAARYGGEEIAILLPKTDKPTARLMAERIRQAIGTHVFVTRETQDSTRITVSVGVAAFPDDAVKARELVHAADMALYAAKQAGKNCVCLA